MSETVMSILARLDLNASTMDAPVVTTCAGPAGASQDRLLTSIESHPASASKPLDYKPSLLSIFSKLFDEMNFKETKYSGRAAVFNLSISS